MKKAVFKAESGKGGFIRTTIAPVNSKDERGFGAWDAAEIVLLVAALLIAMRFLLAH